MPAGLAVTGSAARRAKELLSSPLIAAPPRPDDGWIFHPAASDPPSICAGDDADAASARPLAPPRPAPRRHHDMTAQEAIWLSRNRDAGAAPCSPPPASHRLRGRLASSVAVKKQAGTDELGIREHELGSEPRKVTTAASAAATTPTSGHRGRACSTRVLLSHLTTDGAHARAVARAAAALRCESPPPAGRAGRAGRARRGPLQLLGRHRVRHILEHGMHRLSMGRDGQNKA